MNEPEKIYYGFPVNVEVLRGKTNVDLEKGPGQLYSSFIEFMDGILYDCEVTITEETLEDSSNYQYVKRKKEVKDELSEANG